VTIAYPDISPVALSLGSLDVFGHTLGPFDVRWYALAYISGLLLGRWYVARLVRQSPFAMTELQVDDLLFWTTLGVVLGGRFGYVLFYKPGFYLQNPGEILAMWHGGMSFHGGLVGVVLAIILYSRFNKLNVFAVGDAVCCAVPLGLFFGRIANFINGELYGRVAPDLEWGMVFPNGGPEPRHPSQLYEAGMEGLALLGLLFLLWKLTGLRERTGMLAGIFLTGYGLARIIAENFRQPDSFLGFLVGDWLTMGQVLSLPLVVAGLTIIWLRNRAA
jgi:phosphatidylglycerol---prolipoprotein diacylglyceryl transferase